MCLTINHRWWYNNFIVVGMMGFAVTNSNLCNMFSVDQNKPNLQGSKVNLKLISYCLEALDRSRTQHQHYLRIRISSRFSSRFSCLHFNEHMDTSNYNVTSSSFGRWNFESLFNQKKTRIFFFLLIKNSRKIL